MSSSGVHSRHRDVSGVANDMRRKDAGSHDSLGQGRGVRRDIKSRQAADDCESLLDLCGVADRSFVDNQLSNPALKLAMPIRPPFLGDPLMAGDNQVTAGTSDQIGNKRSFQVYRFHAGSFAASTQGFVRPHSLYARAASPFDASMLFAAIA